MLLPKILSVASSFVAGIGISASSFGIVRETGKWGLGWIGLLITNLVPVAGTLILVTLSDKVQNG